MDIIGVVARWLQELSDVFTIDFNRMIWLKCVVFKKGWSDWGIGFTCRRCNFLIKSHIEEIWVMDINPCHISSRNCRSQITDRIRVTTFKRLRITWCYSAYVLFGVY